MPLENAIILLVAIATSVAMLARWANVPYTIALVVTGLVLGSFDLLKPPHLTQHLLFAIFLPGLLFEAAYHVEYRAFKANARTIVALAVPGVAAAIGLTAVLLEFGTRALPGVTSWTLAQAAVFGSIIAATDPIAVVSLFKTLGVPARLNTLIEGESLLNDGTSIVFFSVVVSLAGGAVVSWQGIGIDLVRVVGVGALIGGAMGYGASQLMRQIDDPMIEITLTMIAAYGSFAAAEQLHGSGVIATVVAGMVCGNYGVQIGMSATTRTAVKSFWEYLTFLLNSLIFLLIGFEVHVREIASDWVLVVTAFLAVLLSRSTVVGLVSTALSGSSERVPFAWTAILAWGGLRGALSMVLALSLPADFPNRAIIINATYGVVVVSILLQGLTMSPLVRWTGIARKESP